MAQLGTSKKPVVGHVKTDVRAQEIMLEAHQLGIKVIIGVEPDKPEDLENYYNAIKRQNKEPLTVRKKPSKNSPCPCGSGKKYKGCCGKSDIPRQK